MGFKAFIKAFLGLFLQFFGAFQWSFFVKFWGIKILFLVITKRFAKKRLMILIVYYKKQLKVYFYLLKKIYLYCHYYNFLKRSLLDVYKKV